MLSSKDVILSGTLPARYVANVNQLPMLEALRKSGKIFNKLLKDISGKKAFYAYAPGKWTIKEMVQHVIDAERVFALRALWFARKDASPLPGFDENTWAANARGNDREWEDIRKEFRILRKSTLFFFRNLKEEQLLAKGMANNNEYNVLAMGYLCAGHVMHHHGILKDRYLHSSDKE